MTLPCIGRERAALSVTDRCRYGAVMGDSRLPLCPGVDSNLKGAHHLKGPKKAGTPSQCACTLTAQRPRRCVAPQDGVVWRGNQDRPLQTHNAAKLNNAGGAGVNPDRAIPRYLSVEYNVCQM